jgi:hypothetical protein
MIVGECIRPFTDDPGWYFRIHTVDVVAENRVVTIGYDGDQLDEIGNSESITVPASLISAIEDRLVTVRAQAAGPSGIVLASASLAAEDNSLGEPTR